MGVVAHSHHHQHLAGAKPTCPQPLVDLGVQSCLPRSDNKNRRDDGTELVLAHQKQSIGLRGLGRREGIFCKPRPWQSMGSGTEASRPIPLQQMYLPAGTVAVRRPRDR